MKVWALLNWYDERADWLREMVESVAPLVDGVVAVDGAYPLTAQPPVSPEAPFEALEDTCEAYGLEFWDYIHPASEVEKRAFLFEAALYVAEPMRDWFLIMDADMTAACESPEDVRRELLRTDCHAAEVTWHEGDPTIDGNPKIRPFRSLFRAIPGLTVEGSHSTYTVPDFHGERLLMWQPIGDRQPVAALDLTRHLHLYHRPHLRDPARQALRAAYYDRRSTANIENVPSYDD